MSSMEKTDLEVPSFSQVRSGSFLATRALIVHVSLYGVSVLTGCADRRRFELGGRAPVLGGLRLDAGTGAKRFVGAYRSGSRSESGGRCCALAPCIVVHTVTEHHVPAKCGCCCPDAGCMTAMAKKCLAAARQQITHCSDGDGPDPGACRALPSSLLTGVCIGATFSFAAEAGAAAAAAGSALTAGDGATSAFTGASSHSILTAEVGAPASVTCNHTVLIALTERRFAQVAPARACGTPCTNSTQSC